MSEQKKVTVGDYKTLSQNYENLKKSFTDEKNAHVLTKKTLDDVKKKLQETTNIANSLYNDVQNLKKDNKTLYAELNRVGGIVGKLPFLFNVLQFKDSFDSNFVISCVDEIKRSLSAPEEEADQPAETEDNE